MSGSAETRALAEAMRALALRLSAAANLTPEILPVDWRGSRANGNRALELRSSSWTSDSIQRLRFTEIDGPEDLYIANIGVLPRPESGLPVVHAETVVIAARLRVFILDIVPLDAASDAAAATDPLRLLRGGLRAVEPVHERPAWADQAISPGAIWGHGSTPAALTEASETLSRFAQVVESLLQDNAEPSGDLRTEGRIAALAGMRGAFIDKEPSRPFLRATFGGDWTERYITEFLFPLPASLTSQSVSARAGTGDTAWI